MVLQSRALEEGRISMFNSVPPRIAPRQAPLPVYPRLGGMAERSTAPSLSGVAFANIMGCGTSAQAAQSGIRRAKSEKDALNVFYYTANFSNIAHILTTKGVKNSVGYKLTSVFNHDITRNYAQAWFNCLYRYGTARPNNANAHQSLLAAERGYDAIIDKWNITDVKNHYIEGQFTADLWHHWVIAYPDKPLLDP